VERKTNVGVSPPQCELPCLGVLETKRLPVEEVRESLRSVSLVNTLSSRLSDEGEHLLLKTSGRNDEKSIEDQRSGVGKQERRREECRTYRELVARVLDRLHPTVDDVNAVVLRVLDELIHKATEAREVGGDGGDAHNGALGWGAEKTRRGIES
jgi:hypothetical protein